MKASKTTRGISFENMPKIEMSLPEFTEATHKRRKTIDDMTLMTSRVSAVRLG